MYTFIGNFLAWLQSAGHRYTQDVNADYDVLFVNSWVVSPRVVARQKRMRPALRVVHRIDGSAEDYGSTPDSDRVQARVNLYADLTIFQSRYSKFSTREKYRVITQDGPIIYNPVDVAQFSPHGEGFELPAARPRVACVSWSLNPRKGSATIDAIAARHPNVAFILSGRFDGVASHANVVRLGHLTRPDLARVLRSCDVFLNVSENDPCPNVVLEALASGLPVLFRDSGGVPELVGDCGRVIDQETFGRALEEVLAERDAVGTAARRRAETLFAAGRIFPEYWEAIQASVRRPIPSAWQMLRLAQADFPVLPRVGTARQLVAAVRRRAPALWTEASRDDGRRKHRIGWITYDSFPQRKRRFRDLDSFTGMRVGNIVRWITAHDRHLHHELYDPAQRYDVVVFQKIMGPRVHDELKKIQAYGGRVVFDANVNYYEDWGDYFVAGTRPTGQQRDEALQMTIAADLVVADSSYLRTIIEPFNSRVVWIADNVDPGIYHGQRQHRQAGLLRLIWCGVAKKAAHVLEIREVLPQLDATELTIVADERPIVMDELTSLIPCRFVAFSDRGYAQELLASDVIVSPKRLANAYEMAHTEYKITLGMAVGLPAVAHPQPSYCEAIDDRGGGFVCRTADEWVTALTQLRDPAVRAALGERARATVAERYATPVVAEQYRRTLYEMLPQAALDAAVP